VFQPNGGNAGSNATFTLCDGRGAARASTVVLANDGRLRRGRPTPAAARACLAPP
jgi:type IV fimbrial biogenesis protein FimT